MSGGHQDLLDPVATALPRLEDVPDGGSRGFAADEYGQDTLFAVRRGQRLYVYRNVCPHQAGPLAWRKDQYLNHDGTRIVCFAHGAQFEIETGRCTLGPCLGQSLEAMPWTTAHREPAVSNGVEP